uniref:Uncharacterized protein n=1 Tax=Chromera velia CCMP2878 TaxID=1169474 RepID=A0A0G4FPC5_9ALVE|eukprot:Cvel_18073.t1-p1 / transcript=Cvel_18073.t1 / gene=Cvel_18073 / organism=Chromera_velia_CCMP2878 / gene_product=Enoyl-CoA hydratase 2, peroxisomal, putative / transcript_product=Enoyl-CoA hydratase 2, peroxisomal, putative / location=Cvel_scaffold1478:14495-17706(+) / protein_length=301 / sequence_SO=supercontig / SO=protein_coding / is_pseudo=false
MPKPDKVIPSECAGYSVGETTASYGPKDVMLYALGLGVSTDPLDPLDLKFTYENAEDFAPLPSFAVVLSSFEDLFGALTACPGLPEFNPMMLLHGEEKVTLFKSLEPEAALVHKASIKNVYDKGSGALLVVVVESFEQDSGEKVCALEHSLFIRGIGGFGGDKGPAPASNKPPKRVPDAVFKKETSANQALIYRLSGDMNPLHADPNMAAMGGFDKPILHGLCFFGIATHGVVREMCENDPSRVLSVEGRFASPVLPGDPLRVEMWKEGGRVLFQVVNERTNKVSLANGAVALRGPSQSSL